MNRTHIWLGLCLLLALALAHGNTRAQEQPGDIATGKGLDEAAEAVVKAVTARDAAALWKQLAPWKRHRFEHFIDDFRRDPALLDVTDKEAAEVAEFLDPENMLKINAGKRLQTLTDGEFFGLLGGVYARPLGYSKNAPEDWKVVEREVGLLGTQKVAGREIQPWGALVKYKSPRYPAISMEFRPTPDGWVLTHLEYGASVKTSFKFELEAFLEGPLLLAHWTSWKGLQAHRVAEAEGLLGAARDYSRVYYAKNGFAPKNLSDTSAEPEEASGEYYEVFGKVYEAREGYDAACYAKPLRLLQPGELADPWVLIEWSWASGNSRFEQFSKLSDLKAALGE